MRIERCVLEEFGIGLHLGESSTGGYPAEDGVVADVWINNTTTNGVALFVGMSSRNWVFERLRTTVINGDHLVAEATGQLEWRDCRMETAWAEGDQQTGQVVLENCDCVRFVNCSLEDHTAGDPLVKPILALKGASNHQVTVDSCRFVRDQISDVEEISVSATEDVDDEVRGLLIVNPIFEKQRAGTAQREIYVKSAESECQVIGGIVRFGGQTSDIQVDIAPSRSSLLGTGSRARLPQLTTQQIANLLADAGARVRPGDLVFDVTVGRLKMAVAIVDPPYIAFKALLLEA